MKNRIFFTILMSLLGFSLFAGAKQEQTEIMATNLWTAAYVEAATGEACPSLAPSDMSHPPEYELTPGDFDKLTRTQYFVYAGYEVMMKEISNSAEISEDSLIAIQTGYSRKVLQDSILGIAEIMDTQEEAEASLLKINSLLDQGKEAVQGSYRALVHFHQQALARELGIEVAAVYGPAPMEAGQLEELAAQEGVNLIIDNQHNPVGKTLVEFQPRASYVSWINFPGTAGTESLIDVIQYNLDQLED